MLKTGSVAVCISNVDDLASWLAARFAPASYRLETVTELCLTVMHTVDPCVYLACRWEFWEKSAQDLYEHGKCGALLNGIAQAARLDWQSVRAGKSV